MRAQAASTERASACCDVGLSGVSRVEAVSTTAFANSKENSTLGSDTMFSTLPSEQKSPARGRWDATSCGCVDKSGG